MDMILSFGYFGKLLVTNKIEKSITQQDFIGNMIRIINPYDPFFMHSPKQKSCDEDEKIFISRILSGKRGFRITANNDIPSLENVIEEFICFEDHFDDTGKLRILLSLYDIIREDKLIESTTRESFFRFFGENKNSFLNRQKFSFSDVCAKTLLYTMCTDIEKLSKKSASKFLYTFVNEEFEEYQNNVLNIYSFEWNATESILTLPELEPNLIEIDGVPPKLTINKKLFYKGNESCTELSSQHTEKEIELQREMINHVYNIASLTKKRFEEKHGK